MLRKILQTLLLVVICLGVFVLIAVVSCEQAQIPPKVPAYPNATLIAQVPNPERVGNSWFATVDYHYASSDSPENIVSFYEAQGYCEKELAKNGRKLCHGNTVHNGSYTVFIDLDEYKAERITPYIIEIRWKGCSYDIVRLLTSPPSTPHPMLAKPSGCATASRSASHWSW